MKKKRTVLMWVALAEKLAAKHGGVPAQPKKRSKQP